MEKEAKVNEAQKRADEAGQKFGMGWLTANSDLDNAKEELEELKNQFNLVEFVQKKNSGILPQKYIVSCQSKKGMLFFDKRNYIQM